MLPWNDPHLRLTRGQQPGAVRSDQARAMFTNEGVGRHHVVRRNAFGNADDQRDASRRRLTHRIRRKGCRDVNDRNIRTGLFDGFRHRVEHRHPAVDRGLPTATRRDTCNHVRAISNHLARMELTLAPGDPLHEQTGVFIDQNAHLPPPYPLLIPRCARDGSTFSPE